MGHLAADCGSTRSIPALVHESATVQTFALPEDTRFYACGKKGKDLTVFPARVRKLYNQYVDWPIYSPHVAQSLTFVGYCTTTTIIAMSLQLYQRAKKLNEHAARATCAVCNARNNLAHCMACKSSFCDGTGHLGAHLCENPTHMPLYSYKLRRVVRTALPSCVCGYSAAVAD